MIRKWPSNHHGCNQKAGVIKYYVDTAGINIITDRASIQLHVSSSQKLELTIIYRTNNLWCKSLMTDPKLHIDLIFFLVAQGVSPVLNSRNRQKDQSKNQATSISVPSDARAAAEECASCFKCHPTHKRDIDKAASHAFLKSYLLQPWILSLSLLVLWL